jgi:hypothetical protein
VAYGGAGTRQIGDLGALAPTLNTTIAPLGATFSASLYFPDTGQLYHTRTDAPFALGNGLRALALPAYLASLEAHGSGLKNAATVDHLAAGDDATLSAVYSQLGGAAGLGVYLTGIGVTGAQLGATWQASQATTGALMQVYAALAAGQILNATDRTTMLGQTPKGNATSAAPAVAAVSTGTGGSVVAGLAQTATGWTLSVFGIAAPQGGPRIVFAAAFRDATTDGAAAQSLAAFFQALSTQIGQI